MECLELHQFQKLAQPGFLAFRAADGFLPLNVPAIAYADRKFESPSGKIEFYSSQAERLGLPPLPVHKVDKTSPYPLALSFGWTLTHFHAFYDEGRALPSLAKHNAAALDFQVRRRRASALER